MSRILEQPISRNSELLHMPVSILRLSTRSRKCLVRLEVTTLADLVQHSVDDLLGTKNFGLISLAEVRARLAQHGLRLRDD